MNNRRTVRRALIGLCGVSAVICILEIVIFRNPRSTFFYIFQDLSFLPLSIAIAAIVTGAVLNEKEKNERIRETRMLRRAFFSSLGTAVMNRMMEEISAEDKERQIEPLLSGPDGSTCARLIRKKTAGDSCLPVSCEAQPQDL